MPRPLSFAVSAAALAAGFAVGLWVLGSLVSERAPGPGGGGPGALPGGQPTDWDTSLGAVPRFVDVTRAAGISFRHENGMTGKFFYPEVMGAGVALFDYDGDGLLDVYFVNGNRLLEDPSPGITNRLYRNNGDWTFTDVTERAGVGDPGYGQGCCVGDYDNDGDQDLHVTNYGANVLYRNDGDGTFTDVTREAGVEDPGWGQSSCFLDYNGDGLLDLYVQNYLQKFESVPEAFIYVGNRKVRDYPSPLGFPGAADRLYRNDGDGTFTNVTREAGLYRPGGKGMGCACVDLNDDGKVDIFVANDSMENYLFGNRGDGTFQEVALPAGVAFNLDGTPEASMGVDVGDFDRDGRLDLIVPCLRQQVYTLYRSSGANQFTDASRAAGLVEATSLVTGFNANFLDYDNDGDLDLFLANGGVRINQLAAPDASYDERYGMPDLLLANDGKGRYTDVSLWAGPYFRRRLVGRGSATGDLDGDGDEDLVVGNLAGSAVVLRNDTASGHWVTLRLVPSSGNRDALGTSVRIDAGGVRQRGVVHANVTYLSQDDRRVHFGLGEATKIDRLRIRWPDGTTEERSDLPADRLLTIEQGKAGAR